MPIEIKVGPPVITISQGRTFMVTDMAGGISSNSSQGAYSVDTRFIIFYRLYINRVPWLLVNSSRLTFYAARIHLTNPAIETEGGPIPASALRLTLNRTVSEGIHEEFELANYSGGKVRLVLELALRCDFSDLFEVKTQHIVLRGKMQTQWDEKHLTMRTSYDNADFHRATAYQVSQVETPVVFANGRLLFDVQLEPNERWFACGDIIMEHGQQIKHARQTCRRAHRGTSGSGATPSPGAEPTSDFDRRQARWQGRCTGLATSNNNVYRTYQQAIEDMGALRIYDLDVSDEAWVPAAGVPWFVTLFGRDSLIASYQNMAVSPGFALGALKRLSEYQAQDRDDWKDAQPGKIMHEIRFGELAHFHKIPFTPYYGTADATPLYLIVLSETYRWTGDLELLKQYRKVIDGCLEWIDHYGDLDGDGFQEYKTFSSLGYENLAWKDSPNSVMYADGSQVKQPKALCELQGYVYDAKVRMVEVFRALGDEQRAQELQEQAETLKRNFNRVFWLENEDYFAYGLDPQKKQITTVASNAGQCLWSGIADQEKAERTAQRLLRDDMWCGWGIRTLTADNPAYNPLSYHNGSVWPHDNGLIAAGFKRYSLAQQANQVIHGVFHAIERFAEYRPPEVFAGVRREGNVDFPVLYPAGANIPQAWATGSVFHMLRTILGLRADAPNRRLYVSPTLPDWLPDVTLEHLRVCPCALTLRFWREGDASRWQVVSVKPEDAIEVLEEPQ